MASRVLAPPPSLPRVSTAHLWRHFDFILLGAVALLILVGIAMIRATTLGVESLSELLPRQMIYASLGVAGVFVVTAIDYHYWHSLWRPIYFGVLVVLALLFITGLARHGAARWFDLVLFELQPSEAAKIATIISLAAVFARDQHKLDQLQTVLKSLAYAAAPVALIFLQPDLSTAIMIGAIWFALIWAAGLRLRHLVLFVCVGLVSPLLLWPFILQDYMRDRVLLFINPNTDPAQKYNIDQALISIGSGGWFGQGYGQGTQCALHFQRVRHTDFIFSCTAEAFGFVGVAALLLLFGLVLHRMLRAARLARDPFGAFLCYGAATMLFYQTVFNIGMNMRLLPVAGLPLPFISYGGSSLLTLLISIGLVESVILRHRQLEF